MKADMISWTTHGNPDLEDSSDLIHPWREYVKGILDNEGIKYRPYHQNYVWHLNEPLNESDLPLALVSAGFEYRNWQYDTRFFYKKITELPPEENKNKKPKTDKKALKPTNRRARHRSQKTSKKELKKVAEESKKKPAKSKSY